MKPVCDVERRGCAPPVRSARCRWLQRITVRLNLARLLTALAAGVLFPAGTAYACVADPNQPPRVLMWIGANLLLVGVLSALAWIIKAVFFRRRSAFAVLLITTLLLSLVLGLIATFALPAFEPMFMSFGVALPRVTLWLLRGRQLLWLPLLLVLGLFYATAGRPARGRYFVAALAIETTLVFFVLASLYAPIHVLGCAV